jgi:hypothetical protein
MGGDRRQGRKGKITRTIPMVESVDKYQFPRKEKRYLRWSLHSHHPQRVV